MIHRLLAVTLFAALSGPAMAADVLPGPVPAAFVDAYDGDTLTVRATIWLDQTVLTRVRLDGLDTPEMKGKCQAEREKAEAAKARLVELASGGVQLVNITADKYGGRVRARVVTRDGVDLAETLISAGLARPYHGEKRRPWCE